jgi:hypothetical protein
MERPVEFHNARVVYYDGVGGFNPNKEIGLPMGFVIERAFLPIEYVAEELKVAVNIAFGHHGFGELFTAEHPFVIIALGKSAEEAEKLKQEIISTISSNENYSNGKIKVDDIMIG